MLAIEPSGLLSADEELRSVAAEKVSHVVRFLQEKDARVLGIVRVGASVGHGQDTRAGVLQGEVLIVELLTVDRLATSALFDCKLASDAQLG